MKQKTKKSHTLSYQQKVQVIWRMGCCIKHCNLTKKNIFLTKNETRSNEGSRFWPAVMSSCFTLRNIKTSINITWETMELGSKNMLQSTKIRFIFWFKNKISKVSLKFFLDWKQAYQFPKIKFIYKLFIQNWITKTISWLIIVEQKLIFTQRHNTFFRKNSFKNMFQDGPLKQILEKKL